MEDDIIYRKLCLFCATRVSDDDICSLVKVETVQDDNEVFITPDDVTAPSPPQLEQSSFSLLPSKLENAAIQGELKAFFILKNLLNIPSQILCQFLLESSSSIHPDLWSQVQVCFPCGKLVRQYYDAFRGHNPGRQNELDRIISELTRKILESMEVPRGSQNHRTMWEQIRAHVFKRGNSSNDNVPPVKMEVDDTTITPDFPSIEGEPNFGDTHFKLEVVDCLPESFHIREESPTLAFNSTHVTEENYNRSDDWKFKHRCPHCPFRNNHSLFYKLHLEVHFEGSPAIPCHVCAVHVLPQKLSTHVYRSHNKKKSSSNSTTSPSSSSVASTPSSQNQKLIFAPEERKLPEQPSGVRKLIGKGKRSASPLRILGLTTADPGPGYFPFRVGSFKHNRYQCDNCSFTTRKADLMETHIKSHMERETIVERGTPEPEPSVDEDQSSCDVAPVVASFEIKSGEILDIGEIVVKTEVVDPDHSPPAPPLSASEEPESELEPNESMQNSEGSSNSKSDLVATRSLRETQECSHCPFKTIYPRSFRTHLKVHEKGVKSTPCPNCGVHLLPEKLSEHRLSHVRHDLHKLRRHEYLSAIKKRNSKSKRKKMQMQEDQMSSNPQYKEQVEGQSRPSFKCLTCPFIVRDSRNTFMIQEHLKLHQVGSPAIPCPDCGIYLLPEGLKVHQQDIHHHCLPKKTINCRKGEVKEEFIVPEEMEQQHRHRETNHFNGQKQEKPSRKTPVTWNKDIVSYNCSHCLFESKIPLDYKNHLRLHEKGSEGTLCSKCRCYFPQGMDPHHNRYFCSKWRRRLPKGINLERDIIKS